MVTKSWTPAPVPDSDPGFAGVTTFYAVVDLEARKPHGKCKEPLACVHAQASGFNISRGMTAGRAPADGLI